MNIKTEARRGFLKKIAALPAATWVTHPAAAKTEWPDKPVRIVVPFPPGGSGDSLARIIGQDIGQRLGQPVIVENKAGGNMFIGAGAVEKAPPDGYTFLLTLDSVLTINPYAYEKLPYDAKAFLPVSLVTTQAQCLVVRKSLGVKNMNELISLAKARPGQLNFGYGSPLGQIAAHILRANSGIEFALIAYKGAAPTALGLLQEEIDIVALDPSLLLQHFETGKMVPLGQVGTTRSRVLPNLPTLSEQGLKGFETFGWFALMAPLETPAAIISRMNKEVVAAIAKKDVQEQILKLGFEPTSSSPKALADRWREDAAKWEKFIRAANIKL